MYKRLQEYNTSLQQYNSKLQTDLSTANESLKKVEKEKLAIVENLSTLRGHYNTLQEQLTSSRVLSFYFSNYILLFICSLMHRMPIFLSFFWELECHYVVDGSNMESMQSMWIDFTSFFFFFLVLFLLLNKPIVNVLKLIFYLDACLSNLEKNTNMHVHFVGTRLASLFFQACIFLYGRI